MSKAIPYIAAAATFVVTGSFQAAQAAFAITSMAVSVLDPPKKPGAQERQASVTTLSLGEQPRELLIGEVCTSGTLVDAFNFGGKYGTDTVTRCIVVADVAIEGVVGYYIDDKFYPWTVDGIQPGFSNKLSIRFYNATADGHDPQAHVLAAGAGWTTADRLAGMAVFWVDTQFDEKVWSQGHPEIKFVLRGIRAYDMRLDPAFGYTGANPQTWENRASHTYTRNAALLRYAFTRGIYAEGHHGDPDYLLIGRGLSAEEAPPERIIAAANLCDETVDGEARYTANGVIRASDDFITVEDMFAAAMAGQIVQREGGVEVEPGQAKAAVVTITDGSLVVGEPVTYSAFLPDTDGGRVNSVLPRYISPTQNWRDFAGPIRRNVEDIAADGGPREATLSLLLVTSGGQADRCAEIMRLAARLERRATIVLPPEYANLEEGDWIAWQSDRHHGGATVRYRIESWSLDEQWRMRLSLREIASSVYGVPDPVEDTATPPPAPQVIDALTLTGVTAEAITLPGDSSAVPAIRFRWDAPVDAAVLAIRAEVRRVGETETAPSRTEQVNDGVMVATNGVGPDQSLQARLVPIGDPSRPVLPSAWITVSTSGLVAGDVSPNAPGLSEIKSSIEAAFGDIFDVSALVSQARTDIDAQGTEIAAARGDQPSLNSRIVQVIQARIDGDTSNAQAIALVQARTENTEADIIDLENALATETGARAQAIQQVTARQAVRPNLLSNPTAASGMQGLSNFGPRTVMAYPNAPDGPQWSAAASGAAVEDFGARWTVFDAKPNAPYSLQAELAGFAQTGGLVRAVGLFQDDSGATLGAIFVIQGGGDFDLRKAENVVSPPGTTRIAFQIDTYQASFGLNGSAAWRRIKLEQGPICTLWTDDASVIDLSATVTQQSLAIIDLENQQALASYQLIAAATGGKPARFGLVSSTAGSYIALDAPYIFWGDNTVFDDATDTLQTAVGGYRRVLAFGAPFGSDGTLLEWWGPSSVALGAMTTANGLNGRMTTAPYIFDNVIGVARFQPEADASLRIGTRTSAGLVTTSTVTIAPVGATGTVGYSWSQIGGSEEWTITAPSAGATAFRVNVATPGEQKRATFACRVHDTGTGKTATVIVGAVAIYNV